MKTTVDALKDYYVEQGGEASAVADITTIPDMIDAVSDLGGSGGSGGAGLPEYSGEDYGKSLVVSDEYDEVTEDYVLKLAWEMINGLPADVPEYEDGNALIYYDVDGEQAHWDSGLYKKLQSDYEESAVSNNWPIEPNAGNSAFSNTYVFKSMGMIIGRATLSFTATGNDGFKIKSGANGRYVPKAAVLILYTASTQSSKADIEYISALRNGSSFVDVTNGHTSGDTLQAILIGVN